MGHGNWNSTDWDRHARRAAGRSRAEIFGARAMHPDLDPRFLAGGVRESVDSAENPQATPIIVTCDVTGSMGVTAEVIVKQGLGVIMQGIYDRRPVTDPHILVGATGDVFCDQAPLQVTQFEADMRLVEQTQRLFLEGGGGGNGGESYNAAWYFAAMHIRADAIAKKRAKGWLFTIGDEPPHEVLPARAIQRVFGDPAPRDLTSREILARVQQDWEVFHLLVNPGSYPTDRWEFLLGERLIPVHDVGRLGEVVLATIEGRQAMRAPAQAVIPAGRSIWL